MNLPFARKFLVNTINRNLQRSELPVHVTGINVLTLRQINISDVLIFGENHDTIVFAGNLDVRIAPRSLLRKRITISSVYAENLIIHLLQEDPDQPLNLIGAFGNDGKSTDEIKDEPKKQWTFDVGLVNLANLDVAYHSMPDNMLVKLVLKDFGTRIEKMDISNRELFIKDILLDEANVKLFTGAKPEKEPDTAGFSFPWFIEIAGFSIRNSSFVSGTYHRASDPVLTPQFIISGFKSELANIKLQKDHLAAKIGKTGFLADNGFMLKTFKGNIDSRPKKATFDFQVVTNESEINLIGESDTIIFGMVGANAESMLSVTNSTISLTDLTYFNSGVEKAAWFNEYGRTPVSVHASVFSTGNIFRFDSIYLYQSGDRWLSLAGEVSDLADSLRPKEFDVEILSSLGNVRLDGRIDPAREKLSATAAFNNIRPGIITGKESLQEINGSVIADVNGFSLDNLYADIKINLNNLAFNHHVYDRLVFVGKVNPGNIDIAGNITDQALTMDLSATIHREKNDLSLQTKGNFKVAPAELNFMKDSLAVEAMFSGNFRKTGNGLAAAAYLSQIELTKPGERAGIDSLLVEMHSDSLNTMITGISDFFSLNFRVDEPVSNSGKFFNDMAGYFGALASGFFLDSSFRDFNIPVAVFHGEFTFHPVMAMLTNDTSLEFSKVKIQMSAGEQPGQFYSSFIVTGIHAGELSVSSVKSEFRDSSGFVSLTAGVDSIMAGSQFFSGIGLSHASNDNNHEGQSQLLIMTDKNKMNSQIKLASVLKDSLLTVSIPSGELLLNGTLWQTGTSELFSYHSGKGEFRPAITLYTDSSEMSFVTIRDNPATGFDVNFDRVDFTSLVPAVLLPGNPAAKINGFVRYRTHENKDMSIETDLELSKVAWSDLEVDRLDISGSYNSTGSGAYRIESNVTMDTADIHLKGNSTSDTDRKLTAEFSALPLNLLTPFVEESISELTGTVSGAVSTGIDDGNEITEGHVELNDVSAHINSLNSTFRIPENKIILADNKAGFNRFRILDSRDNELFIDGHIEFSNRDDVIADLDISSPKMLVMNSTREDNQSFYGTVLVGTQMSVKGPLMAPAIQGSLSLDSGTEIFYANQTSYQLQDMSQTVTFINTGADSTESGTEESVGGQKAAIEASVEVDPATILHFSLEDQLYNISLNITGGGTLNYNVFSNNQSNLTGLYEISEGEADVKIRGWSNKKFTIADGSFIRWIDRTEDPELQIEAQNLVTGKYRNPADRRERIVEFNVVLKVSNRLSDLDVLFTVTTEDQYLMSIINSMSPEDQMKQAVSLLLFQTINIPGIYTTSNQITEQVNQIVESQLNKLTQTSIKSFDISLGVDSYTTPTASGSEETQTSLSYDIKKNIFEDRASVQVSGRLNNLGEQGNDDNTMSNFTFEYRIDSAATKYLQVFRRRSYEDILEGEVERTGAGLILRKTFDSFRDIFAGKRKRPARTPNAP